MAVAAQLKVLDRSERRWIEVPGTVRSGIDPLDIMILNLSSTGFLARLDKDLEVGRVVSVGAASIGRVGAHVVWKEDDLHGFEFDEPLASDVVREASRVENVIAMVQASGAQLKDEQTFGYADDDTARFSARSRMMIILGSAVASWTGVIAGAVWLIRLA